MYSKFILQGIVTQGEKVKLFKLSWILLCCEAQFKSGSVLLHSATAIMISVVSLSKMSTISSHLHPSFIPY